MGRREEIVACARELFEEIRSFEDEGIRREAQLLNDVFFPESGEPLIRELYRKALYRGEGFYPYKDANGQFEAEIADVELTGHLLLRTREGETRRYAFKEVSCVL